MKDNNVSHHIHGPKKQMKKTMLLEVNSLGLLKINELLQ